MFTSNSEKQANVLGTLKCILGSLRLYGVVDQREAETQGLSPI